MKFTALVTILPDKFEEKAVEVAKEAGAGGVTIVKGHNIGLQEKKIFFGLTLEESVSILLFIMPRRLSIQVLRALRKEFQLDDHEKGNGIAFTMPLSHVAGFDNAELHKFEKTIKNML